jgi:hypothetical protein
MGNICHRVKALNPSDLEKECNHIISRYNSEGWKLISTNSLKSALGRLTEHSIFLFFEQE